MSKETSRKVASQAGKTLQSPTATRAQRSAAGSALTQFKSAAERTHALAASRASQVMRDPNASKAAKAAAASTLSQRAR